MRHHHRKSRAGTVLVLFVVSLVALMTFLALAIDLGMIAVARTQCQDAADAAAMTGARTLNGDSANNNNYSSSSPNAITAATNNTVLGKAVLAGNVNVQIGRYTYDSTDQRFEGLFPGPSTENWSMVKTTVSNPVSNALAFSKVFNFTGTTLQATATAAHRPRDIALILDFSGSMRFASLMGTPYSGTSRNSNNPDGVIPTFGHYSSGAGLQASTFTSPYDAANITTTTSDGRAPIVADFYTDAGGTAAFSAASASYGSTPAGDKHLKKSKNTSPNWCTTAYDLLFASGSASNSTRDATFETSGYTSYGMATQFNGYTQGPGYWGKTFFAWPPDPVASRDWRKLYFDYPSSATPMDDNSRLWDTSGNWRAPGSATYQVDYAAILNFIKNVGPNAFPNRLQSGRILYYDAIPSTISTGSWPPSDMNQRFWKDYIDYVLGAVQTGGSSWTVIASGATSAGYTGYGEDFQFGTVKITAKSSLTGTPKPYMHYADNPRRPGTHFWFGPMSMIDFLGNYNLWNQSAVGNSNNSRYCWWPGTCHEAPLYACKLGVRAGLTDIFNNHPNDLVSLIYFSEPQESAGDGGRFNRPRVGLGRDYARMQEALWYPPSTLGTSNTVRPYASDNLEVPRSMGATSYAMALMLAYNQFSANTSLRTFNPSEPSGDAGGNGRKGAQKLVIFETDGSPNTSATAGLNNLGTYNSYYSIRYNSASPGSSEFPTTGSSNVTTQINNLVTQLAALDSASPPGYSSNNKKLQMHCIGFGPEFSPSGPNRATNIAVLNQMQTLGNVTDGMPSYKIIYGTESQVANALQTAFTKILQSGVQVSLIQ